MMKGYRVRAMLHAKQRKSRQKFKDAGFSDCIALNHRFWRATYRRASITLCRSPLA